MSLFSLIKQKSYERIAFMLRRHPLILLSQIFLFFILLAIPIIIYEFIKYLFPALLTDPVSYPLLILALSVYLLSIWLFTFTAFLDYWLDLWIITNDRLINIEQEGLFSRTVSELDLYKIQDTTSEVKGLLPTFFNYGNIYVQTAGEKQRFILEQIPNPHEFRKKIMDLVEEDRKYHQNQISNI